MLLYAQPGTEQYIPFAKRKLAFWKSQYAAAGVPSFHKRVDVSDGSAIYVDSVALGHGQYNDRIRITGGVKYSFIGLSSPAITLSYFPVTSNLPSPQIGTAASFTGSNTVTVAVARDATNSYHVTGTGAWNIAQFEAWSGFPINLAVVNAGVPFIVSGTPIFAGALVSDVFLQGSSNSLVELTAVSATPQYASMLIAIADTAVNIVQSGNMPIEWGLVIKSLAGGRSVAGSIILFAPMYGSTAPGLYFNKLATPQTWHGDGQGHDGGGVVPYVSSQTQVIGKFKFSYNGDTNTMITSRWVWADSLLGAPVVINSLPSVSGVSSNALLIISAGVIQPGLTPADSNFQQAVLSAFK
jgi:hypothetical protein